jgi:hypothetical protein
MHLPALAYACDIGYPRQPVELEPRLVFAGICLSESELLRDGSFAWSRTLQSALAHHNDEDTCIHFLYIAPSFVSA